MKKFGDIITEIASINSYAFDDKNVEDTKHKNDIETNHEIVEKWKSERTQNKLKIEMENAQPDRGAPGIEYPNYISWIEVPNLELRDIRNRTAYFWIKSRFCAERITRDFGRALIITLKTISPDVRALKISGPDDEMFHCERAVIYEEYM